MFVPYLGAILVCGLVWAFTLSSARHGQPGIALKSALILATLGFVGLTYSIIADGHPRNETAAWEAAGTAVGAVLALTIGVLFAGIAYLFFCYGRRNAARRSKEL